MAVWEWASNRFEGVFSHDYRVAGRYLPETFEV